LKPYFVHTILGVLLLFTQQLQAQEPATDALQRPITLQSDSVAKHVLLDTLEKVAGVYFSYDPQLISANTLVAVAFENKSLYEVLSAITDTTVAAFKALGNQIIFYPANTLPSEPKKPEYKVVAGVITEGKKQEPIAYCHVLISGQAIGTITNLEGRFSLKIPEEHFSDTLRFSCIGYSTRIQPISEIGNEELTVQLNSSSIQLKAIDVTHYNPMMVLDSVTRFLDRNYSKEPLLFTTFYREIIKQDGTYADISEAVIEVMKAPYDEEQKEDMVHFLKGRKSSNATSFDRFKLRMKGGPYYMTKLDVVKNQASFIHPDFRGIYKFSFIKNTLLDDRETLVIGFLPVGILRDMLYEGQLYIDRKTWAISRVEFNLTRQGLKEARAQLIEKEPKKMKAIPIELEYTVTYKFLNGKWYLHSLKSDFDIKLIDKQNHQRTRFYSSTEMLTTQIEADSKRSFNRKELFRPNEFVTEKMDTYDKDFWEHYNVIEPEEELTKAIRTFSNTSLQIQNTPNP
jgi:hypothetical protein